MTDVPERWHPYEPDQDVTAPGEGPSRRFVQRRLAQLDEGRLQLAAGPVAELLRRDDGSVHAIEPATVPHRGLRLERGFVLARATDAGPVLWVQRRRLPNLTPPVSGLRFDAAVPVVPLYFDPDVSLPRA